MILSPPLLGERKEQEVRVMKERETASGLSSSDKRRYKGGAEGDT